jgi:putative heme transporter
MSDDNKLTTETALSESPPWPRSAKVIVAVAALLLALGIIYRFQSLLTQIIIAAILAYVLNPVVVQLDTRTGLKRSTGILLVYLLLATAVIGGFVALGFAAFEQASSLITQLPQLIERFTAVIEEFAARTDPIAIGPFLVDPGQINVDLIQQQLIGFIEPLVNRGGQLATNVATATLVTLGNIFFIFIISIYLAIEIPRLGERVASMAQLPGYRRDVERLLREFGRIWSAYLRGQVILGVIIFFIVWLGLALLGVQNSLALGLFSGLLEFIPVVGPIIGAVAAVTVALFQPETMGQMANWQYAGVILIFMIIVQQVENIFLVPRIVGESLELHPLVVIVGVLMGSSLAGILGAILAAPVIATLKLLGMYAWRKMFDHPPFPHPEKAQEESTSSKWLKRGWKLLSERRSGAKSTK